MESYLEIENKEIEVCYEITEVTRKGYWVLIDWIYIEIYEIEAIWWFKRKPLREVCKFTIFTRSKFNNTLHTLFMRELYPCMALYKSVKRAQEPIEFIPLCALDLFSLVVIK